MKEAVDVCEFQNDKEEPCGEEKINLWDAINKYLPPKEKAYAKRLLYGNASENLHYECENDLEIRIESMVSQCAKEQVRERRVVRAAIVQNSIVQKNVSRDGVVEEKKKLLSKIENILKKCQEHDANVVCLQETWFMPFAFCTREQSPWLEYAEDPEKGLTTNKLRQLAAQYRMVIISPILERCEKQQNVIYNTAVVIDANGQLLGKERKFHIPRVKDFNESTYYLEGPDAPKIYQTLYGKIGVNICYGRHHPLHWQYFGLHGAEMVFNPCATVSGLSESLWFLEGRNAAVANSYYTFNVNRVGCEKYPNMFNSGDGAPPHRRFGHFYGSSYVAGPDGSSTPPLNRMHDGILLVDMDLNLCNQVRDVWKFQATARYKDYAEFLQDYCSPDFEPNLVTSKATLGSK